MVAWNELGGSPKFEVHGDGSTAERRGLVAWNELDALVADIFPPSLAGGPGGQQPGAAFPTRPHLRAEAIQIQPFGERIIGPDTTQAFESTAQYDHALVVVRYATPKSPQDDVESQDDGDPVPFLRHRWTIGGELLSLPTAGLEWAAVPDLVPEDVNASLFVPTIEHEISLPRVLDPPFAAIRDRVGTVNDTAISFSTGAIQAETLLFLGAQLERSVLSDGQRAWELNYRFSERRVFPRDLDLLTAGFGGWNHFWLGGNTDGGWYRLQRKNSSGGSPDLFRRTDFVPLFQTESP
jgi:hypothetical protein